MTRSDSAAATSFAKRSANGQSPTPTCAKVTRIAASKGLNRPRLRRNGTNFRRTSMQCVRQQAKSSAVRTPLNATNGRWQRLRKQSLTMRASFSPRWNAL